jgi:hypothetical protein
MSNTLTITIPAGTDAAERLNKAFAALSPSDKCWVIEIPAGDYYYGYTANRIEWLDREFIIHTEGVRLHHSGPMPPPDGPLFTFGRSPGNQRVTTQRINGLELWGKGPAGFCGYNAGSDTILENCRVVGFDAAYQQTARGGDYTKAYSHGFTMRDCRAEDCATAIEQTGVPDARWGLQCSALRIDGLTVSSDHLECCMELRGYSTRAMNVHCQGGLNPYLARMTGNEGGCHDVHFQYFEADYPCRVLSETPGNVLRVPWDRMSAKYIDLKGFIQVT